MSYSRQRVRASFKSARKEGFRGDKNFSPSINIFELIEHDLTSTSFGVCFEAVILKTE